MTILLTCEHYSNHVPEGFSLCSPRLETDWYDFAAKTITDGLDDGTFTVLKASCSRQAVDFNRGLANDTLFVQDLSSDEKRHLLDTHYFPYHMAIYGAHKAHTALISIHSFDPHFNEPNDPERDFDIGILYRKQKWLARFFYDQFAAAGFRVRFNEPYNMKTWGGYVGQKNEQFIPSVVLEFNNEIDLGVIPVVKRVLETLDAGLLDKSLLPRSHMKQ